MDQICLVVPLLPGRTADARVFMRELRTGRNADYQLSEQRIGIVKQAWYLAHRPRATSWRGGSNACSACGLSGPPTVDPACPAVYDCGAARAGAGSAMLVAGVIKGTR